jgi:hypothetical protein
LNRLIDVKVMPEIIDRLIRITDRWSRRITARDHGEFTWPPEAPAEAYDFKTGQIVSVSRTWEHAQAPRATAPGRRRVLWRPGKLIRPIVVTLIVLAIAEIAYLGVHLVREERRRDNPSFPLTSAPAIAARSAVLLPSISLVRSDPLMAPAVAPLYELSALFQSSLVDSRKADVDHGRDRGQRPPSPRATGEQSRPIAAPPAPGWFSVALPIQAQIFENELFVGTTDGSRVMLSPGRHQLQLVNESLRYREFRSVEIQSGQATPFTVVLPTGRLQVNAVPWSEVVIDGERVGYTPLGDLRLPIGAYRVVFRHPQLGELTRTAVIVAGASTRLSVNFSK